MKLEAGQFYGKTSQTLVAEGFRFTEKAYSLDTNIPKHSHELAHFCFVLKGSYAEKIGREGFERNPTALVYYPPDVSHAEEHHTNGRHFLVEIDNPGLKKVRDFGGRLDEPVILGGENSLWLATRMYQEFTERDEFSALALESITNELLIAASRKTSPKSDKKAPKWLERVQEYLAENYSDSIGLNELAKIAEVHPTHLARVFRQFENCTAGDYVRKIRIEKARHKMISSKRPLVDIALETGFSDQSHFTRSFKNITGMTPRKYRELFKSC
jgi:AraC family transcriptional regulator